MKAISEKHGDITVVAITDIGDNHRVMLMPNQDSIRFSFYDEDFVLAISDGVGSCSCADIGSKAAVEACIQVFTDFKLRRIPFGRDAIANALLDSWKNLLGDCAPDDCCATLKAVFKVGNSIEAISIGDGILAVTSDGIGMKSPSEEVSFTNETKCLSSRATPNDFWVADFRLDTYKSYAVMCCTDGVSNGLIEGTELKLLTDIEKSVKEDDLEAELIELIQDISEYCFDDRTIGVIKHERKN